MMTAVMGHMHLVEQANHAAAAAAACNACCTTLLPIMSWLLVQYSGSTTAVGPST